MSVTDLGLKRLGVPQSPMVESQMRWEGKMQMLYSEIFNSIRLISFDAGHGIRWTGIGSPRGCV